MPIPPFQAAGRGKNYSRRRGLVETTLQRLYSFDWPARAWARVPGSDRVHRVEHHVPARQPLRAPLRLAFVSDLHLGPTTPARTLDRAFARLAEAEPDVLLLGGDYVYLEATPAIARQLRDRVAAVPARVKLAVLGNHDLWTHHERLEDALGEAGARVLVNDAARLPAPHDEVAIVGLDDPWTGRPDAARALAAAAGASVVLGLCHSPDAVPLLDGRGVSLLLAGHTHGGQIALPGPRPIIVPGRLGRRWPFGLHRAGDLTLFVSRGVGGTGLPMRVNAPADVAVITVT